MENKDKHILVFNRSFWPDIEATGQFLTELCEELAKKYKVTVIAGRSYYRTKEAFRPGEFCSREKFNGVEILRVRHTRFWKGNLTGRIINWVTYGVLSFIVSLRETPFIIIACTDPPFLGIMAMVVSHLKSVPFIYNCRDLYPDVALELGKLKRGFLSRGFDYINKRAFLSARFIIPLGQSMENRLLAKGISKKNIRVISDWVDTCKIAPISKKENTLLKKLGLENKFVIMHSGNIGLSQDFSLIIKAISTIKDKFSFYLVFIGEGAGKEKLKSEAKLLGLKNILYLPYQPKDLLSFSLSMADLHLVTLKKGMAGAVIPSKVYGIMAAGRPYLAITDKESEPAHFAEEFGCGLWVPPGNLNTVTSVLDWALTHPEDLEKMGKKARCIAEERFDKNVVINKWFQLLDRLGP